METKSTGSLKGDFGAMARNEIDNQKQIDALAAENAVLQQQLKFSAQIICNQQVENERLQQQLNVVVKIKGDNKDEFDWNVLDEIHNVRAENERLIEALKYYADLSMYYGCGDIGMEKPADVMIDKGDIARAALSDKEVTNG